MKENKKQKQVVILHLQSSAVSDNVSLFACAYKTNIKVSYLLIVIYV